MCNNGWVNLQNDSKIAEKLLAIKDQVNVLEEVLKIKGNVELSSIDKAKQLNEKESIQLVY